MHRRSFLAASAASLALPSIARGAGANVLKFVPQADVPVLDPVWTTTYPTRDHGYLVFDTLFGMDSAYAISPQMLAGAVTGNDGRQWDLTLRDGLKFHDGAPVLARDAVASIRRWGVRDTFGQALMAATDEISAPDDKTIRFRLKQPFPLLPTALGKSSPNMCAIMPERLVSTDPFKQVTEMLGSGPYRFKADERVPGALLALLAYERFDGYVPRQGGLADWTAGPKVAHIERIEWHIMPDANSVLSAMRRGEIDWWWVPDADLVPALGAMKNVTVRNNDPTGLIATMRFNHAVPPFDNPALRRAVLGAVSQRDFMEALAGTDRAWWRDGVGVFCPGTPLANDAGMEVLTGPRDLAKSRAAVQAAGYRGEKVVVLGASDIAASKALSDVGADLLGKLGLNVDYQMSDWGTVVQRRVKTDPVEQGGWSVFHTFWSGTDMFTPAGHAFLRGNGRAAAPGWPNSPEIEALRDAWFKAPDLAAQQQVARQLQLRAFQDVPYAPLGQQLGPTAFQSNLSGVLKGIPVFWNVRRG
jgi:peptide/nickel transport system substrate-binding protein